MIKLLILYRIWSCLATPLESLSEETETVVHFKRQAPFYLQHDLGDVSIQGWNQDFIQLKLKKTASVATEFAKYNVVSLETPNAIEVRVGTSQGTDLLTKLRNKLKKDIRIDLEIKAPSNLPLTLLIGPEKKLKIHQWKGKMMITGKQNFIELSRLNLKQGLTLNCPHCEVSVMDSSFHGSLLVGDQKINLSQVKVPSENLVIFTQKGSVFLEGTQGHFQVKTQAGDIDSLHHQGQFQIQTESGKVKMVGLNGNLDVNSVSGSIYADADSVKNRMDLSNTDGTIELSLPHGFAGEVSLQSLRGDVTTDFALLKRTRKTEMLYGPELKGKIFGTIGSFSKVRISASSNSGKINLHQKSVQESGGE